jgi:hypothetical protein
MQKISYRDRAPELSAFSSINLLGLMLYHLTDIVP